MEAGLRWSITGVAALVEDDEQDDACDENEEGYEEMAVGDDGPGLMAEAQSVLHAAHAELIQR